MKAVAIILSIIAFGICLIVGIQAGSRSLAHPTPAATSTPNLSISPSQQRTIVLIVTDDVQSPTPHLFGVWLALYRLDVPQVVMVPLYPNSSADPSVAQQDLVDSFALSSDHTPSLGFFSALREFHFEWNGYILSDLTGLARLVDWVGGVHFNGQDANGSMVLSELVSPWDDLTAAFTSQENIFKNLCDRSVDLPVDTDWMKLTKDLSPRHLQSNLDLQLVVADWKSLISQQEPVTCQFPSQ